jgi:oligoendopeptidase F
MPTPLPNWDMTPIFPSLESPEFQAAFDVALAEIGDLAAKFDEFGVRRRDVPTVDADWIGEFETILNALNELDEKLNTIGSYIGCFVTTDAKNEVAKSRQSQLETRTIVLGQLQTRLVAWIGSSDVEALLAGSQLARGHEYFVRRARYLEAHQMSESEENLASSLAPMASSGWSKLHSQISAMMTVKVPVEGQEKTLSMSEVRGLAGDPNRETRKAAFEAEIKAWEGVAPTMAAALNGIKGFQRELRVRRGFADDVEPTLYGNSIDADTLKAMQDACVAFFPDFRRYMKLKARALGIDNLAWYDLIAPIATDDDSSWDWEETEKFTEEQFGKYSEKMAKFARRSFDEKWTDAGPRVGKVGGAYCTGTRPGESRVLMNFDGSFTAVSTLAHELGHAYHNLCMGERTPVQSSTPMTLAETASIFCETLVFEGAVSKAEPKQRIALLDNACSRNLQVVVDIHSRFLFEKSVFEKRGERDLTENEFSDLMTQAQVETYGEELEPKHPYMWAVKGHYYGPRFYNYPYTFGLLLALGLYAIYEKQPEEFRAKYDEFLSMSGMADARTLGQTFGFDVQQREFWEGSLSIIRSQIDELEKLIG